MRIRSVTGVLGSNEMSVCRLQVWHPLGFSRVWGGNTVAVERWCTRIHTSTDAHNTPLFPLTLLCLFEVTVKPQAVLLAITQKKHWYQHNDHWPQIKKTLQNKPEPTHLSSPITTCSGSSHTAFPGEFQYTSSCGSGSYLHSLHPESLMQLTSTFFSVALTAARSILCGALHDHSPASATDWAAALRSAQNGHSFVLWDGCVCAHQTHSVKVKDMKFKSRYDPV